MVRFILLLLSLTLFADVGNSQSTSPNKEPERVKPVVTVQDQPGAPLKIASTETKWATPDYQILEIYVRVENVSEQKISSYGWRIDTDGSQNKDGCFMYNLPSPHKILQPGDSDGKSTWRKFPVDSPTPSISLSVDFVEFADGGGTWGLDICRSAEALSGLRAGALAAKERFAQTRLQDGEQGLISLLKQDVLVLEAPAGHSTAWVEAFREGVRRLFEKLRRAKEEGGLLEVERVFKLPFDASG